ncbi:hypothetical protein MLD38_009012 [Melastoma candidum]|uniref:Uncharacterized protein n=1 Tax=Melastoma candidum TaxID=119954 RepID=A0ACB9RZ81_9MYRT|nr:hypothetical protein MLD38_009012 [Melastoma candidum]
MDDVDRLFKCFRCGISPPQSAARERKRLKGKPKQGSPEAAVSSSKEESPSRSDASDVLLCTEKVGSTTIRGSKLKKAIHLSPVVFYGSPNGVPPKKPSSLLRLLREIRIEQAAQHPLNLRNKIWATFPRQDEAIKFAKNHPHVNVFSYQDHFNGQRRFLVSTYHEFWRRYNNMDSKLRHHYEVIQEGFPCHLYFDLEFSMKENSGNGDEMVDLLILVVYEVLFDKYSIQGKHDWIVELDSSTKEKFSRHLVLRIPKAAFKDNSHAGAFVTEVCSRISSARETESRYELLFVKKDSGSTESTSHLFVDTAVYSRNRCFRLAFSSKAGKTSVLLPTKRFEYKGMSDKDMFLASLICNIDADCEKLLVCKPELDCARNLQFHTEVNADVRKENLVSRGFGSNTFNSNSLVYYIGKSLFPTLDHFVESVASTGTTPGKIQSWYWFSEHELLVYTMSRNRFCERIGREHKSNHVIYVFDLKRAIYYQKCHDPDCRGYRSPSRLIPDSVLPDQTSYLDSAPMTLAANSTDIVDHSLEETIDNYDADSWWLEAMKLANSIECQQLEKLSKKEGEDIDEDEDEDWWLDVVDCIPS